MKSWILSTGFILLFSSIQALGQTSHSLESKYGKKFNAFEIRPGIMLRIQQGNQGQVTEMRVEPFSGTEDPIHLGQTMDAYLIKEIIDELVPIDERGNQGPFFGLTLLAGGGFTAGYDYESVSITLLGSMDSKKIQSPNRYKKDNPFQSAEIIIVKWKNR
jgi:hypothetical protein